LISKILVGRKTSEVVENAVESSFGEGQGLLRAMSAENRFVRKKAAEVIGDYSADPVKEILEYLVWNDPDSEVRRIARDSAVCIKSRRIRRPNRQDTPAAIS